MTTLIDILLQPSTKTWLERLLSIEGQVSLAVEHDSSLIQDRLASRKNFRVMASLNEVNGFPKLIEEDSGISAPDLASSLVPQFLRIYNVLGIQVSVTPRHLKRRLRQRRYSLTTLELFTTCDRGFIAV